MKVTLETLKADIDAAHDAYRESMNQLRFVKNVHRLSEYVEEVKRLSRIAVDALDLYWVARDYGLEAAMLYKLSDGAIDPRKAGDA